MKTLSDFKRELKTHKNWLCTHILNGVERKPEVRIVEKVQNNSCAFKRREDQFIEYCNGGRTPKDCVWLDFPNKEQIEDIGEYHIFIKNYDDENGSHYIRYEKV